MNMGGTFKESFSGSRPLAQHCAELVQCKTPTPEDCIADISGWRRDLGIELAQELGQLLTGGKLAITIAEHHTSTGQEVYDRIGPVAANSLLRCSSSEATVLFTLDFATAIALTDCSFGGEGRIAEDAPEQLPVSAALLVEKIAGMVAQAIAVTNGSAENARGDVLVRSESVTRLKPFAPDTSVASFPVHISMNSGAQWTAHIAVSETALRNLLPGSGETGLPTTRHRTVPNDGGTAFSEMPLPIEAVLTEFDMSLSRLERLSPGDEIPLAIASDLPLRVDEDVFAYGKLGTLDNRMAVRLTRLHGQPVRHAATQSQEAAA